MESRPIAKQRAAHAEVMPWPEPPLPIPRLSSYLVPRPRLFAHLDERKPLTLVRAPLGFGKTTLVAQWLQARPGEFAAWMTVERDAADTEGFWQTLLDALVEVGLTLSRSSSARPPRAQARQAVVASGRDMVVVVDAFERVTDKGLDVALLDLLRTTRNLRLVVCLRGHRYFPSSQYLDLDFTVIPANEMPFTLEETATLFHDVGAELSDEQVQAVQVDGGGWVEPTRAFAIARRDSAVTWPSDQAAVTEVAATYLRERLLPAIEDGLVDLALATSLVDRLSPEVARVLGDDRAATQLQRLEADGILHSTLDNGEVVYRWPPATRQAMVTELARRSPEQVRHLHSHLAAWYLTDDQAGLALRHGIAAEDWPLVVQIIERQWRSLLVGHPDVLFAALSVTPFELIEASPRVLAVRDLRLRAPDDRILTLLPGLPDDGQALRDLGDTPQAGEVIETGLAITAALRRRGLFRHAADYSDRLATVAATAAVRRNSEVAAALPAFQFQLGVTRLLTDDLVRAHQPLQAAYETASESLLPYLQSDAPAKLALLHAFLGDTQAAATWLRRHDEAPEEEGWFRRLITSTAVSARTLLAIERLDLDRAADIAATTVGDLGTDEFWVYAAYARALLALYTGDALGGLRHLDHARSASPAWHGEGSTARPLLASVEADLLLSLGQANQAAVVLLAAGPGHPYLRVPAARLELLAGHPEAALRLATDLDWARGVERSPRVEMLLMQAVAHHRLEQPEEAIDALRRALSASLRTGTLRPFVTVPRHELMAVAEHLPDDVTATLRHVASRCAASPFPDRVHYVQLTRREQTILEKIAEGLLVRQIAESLYVSVATVKSHLRSLYHKLSAENRRAAVSRGRQLGFLPGEYHGEESR
jgi:LuxR family transcriptional regulator, maltose regulon positive regulatory protein